MSNAEKHAKALADYVRGDPTMLHSGHIERLMYGWWERKHGHVLLPYTLSQRNNFVITHEELCAYDMELVAHGEWLDRERKRVENTLRALRRGKQNFPWNDKPPTCFTIAHILESMIAIAKFKLATINILNYICQERVGEQRSRSKDDQGAGRADP